MKTVKNLSLVLASTILLISCKNPEKENSLIKTDTKEDLAIAESVNSEAISNNN